jgi:cytochrome b6-f complex iron-sulfur subunit
MTKESFNIPRRDFLGRAWAGLGLLAAVATGYIGLRYLTSQTTEDEFGRVITAGLVGDFPPNTVTAFPNGKFYLARRDDGGFLALHHKCTHLACVVLWREAERQFYCPCHGSRFQPDGTVLNRPASRSLARFPIGFEDNYVLVDTSTLIKRDRVDAGDVAYPAEQGAAT